MTGSLGGPGGSGRFDPLPLRYLKIVSKTKDAKMHVEYLFNMRCARFHMVREGVNKDGKDADRQPRRRLYMTTIRRDILPDYRHSRPTAHLRRS